MLSHQLHIVAISSSAMRVRLNEMLFKSLQSRKTSFCDWYFFHFYVFVNKCLHSKDVVCSLFSKEKSNLALMDVAATQIEFNSLIEAAAE